MKETPRFIFRTKSLLIFVREFFNGDINGLCSMREFNERTDVNDVNWKNFFRDSIHIRKDKGIKTGDTIEFELDDFSAKSQQNLVNKYRYNVYSYDSATLELRLIDFKIEVVTY